jgi:hypothetical protein
MKGEIRSMAGWNMLIHSFAMYVGDVPPFYAGEGLKKCDPVGDLPVCAQKSPWF